MSATNRVFALVFFLIALNAIGANRYVRQGASGANNGTDWNNAYTTMPDPLTRGDTYYVADGSYNAYTFNDNNSGTTLITIKKASVADHGTDTGWSDTYGDGEAVFNGTLQFTRDYFVVDGSYRDETTWTNGYGFRAAQLRSVADSGNGSGGDNITARYIRLGGDSFFGQNWQTNVDDSVYFAGGGWKTNLTVAQCYLKMNSFAQNAGCDGINYISNLWAYGFAKEAMRGQYGCKNGVIAYNRFWQASLPDAYDPTATSSTAVIGIWDESIAGSFDNWQIYGNNIWYTSVQDVSDAGILVGGGPSYAGVHANNVNISTNTFSGYGSEPAKIIINGGAATGVNKTIQGNRWWNCSNWSVSTAGVNAVDNANLGAAPWTTWEQFIAYGLPSGGEPEPPSPPVLILSPLSTNVHKGFGVTLTGHVQYATYTEWRKGDTAVATGFDTLVLNHPAQSGLYALVGTNSDGSVTSAVANVFIYSISNLTTGPMTVGNVTIGGAP